MKDQNLKVGDKLVCKKEMLFVGNILYREKNEYTIIDISCYNGIDKHYNVRNDIFIRTFFTELDLYKYFDSKKEIRKMKLDSLYEKSES